VLAGLEYERDDALKLPEGMDKESFFAERCPPLPVNFEIQKDEPEAIGVMQADRPFKAKARASYTEEQWHAIQALGRQIDGDLLKHDVRLTMGGEPTFVSIDDPDGAAAIKKSRYALLKSPWNLSAKEWDKLAAIQKHNAPLYRAYLLKVSLAAVFEETSRDDAEQELDRWLAWASRSRLGPFVKAAQTIRKYKDGILAYVVTRLTNGLVEGFNNKLRMIARRAFGFHSAGALIGMLFLCCGGVALDPPLPGPWCTW